MPKRAKDLTALEVSRLNKPGNHPVGGILGLYLYVNEGEGKSWILRATVGSKRRHIGLGSFPSVTLKMAHEKARHAKQQIEAGVDPIVERKSLRLQLQREQAAFKSFEEASRDFLTSQGDSWENPKHRAQWSSTLSTYAYPHIGSLHVKEITHQDILSVLNPIWKTKTETASRLRGRIERILDWAKVHGLREGENPARWKGHLDKLLPAPSKIQKVTHHRALPVASIPEFMLRLSDMGGIAARALQFAIFTAARSGEVRGATWKEIDIASATWIVPASRMKAGREHRVPLSQEALDVLRFLPTAQAEDLVFKSPTNKQLSDMSLLAVLRRMEVAAVPHGFRSSFRDWVGEMTDYPRELAEQALAHVIANKVEAAYRRADGLEKRRPMMEHWATFCRGINDEC